MSAYKLVNGVLQRSPCVLRSVSGSVRRAIKAMRADPALADPYWKNVIFCVEHGRLHDYGARHGQFGANAQVWSKALGQIDVSPSWGLTFNSSNVVLSQNYTIEWRGRANSLAPSADGGTDYLTWFAGQTQSDAYPYWTWLYQYNSPPKIAVRHAAAQVYGNNILFVSDTNFHEYAMSYEGITSTSGTIRWFRDGSYVGQASASGMESAQFSTGGAMFIGRSPLWSNGPIQSGGISIERARFTQGVCRYTGDYQVPDQYYPYRESLLDAYWPETVFCYDSDATPGELRDLTGRHTVSAFGAAGMDTDGATTGLGGGDYFSVLGNLDDFVLDGDFTIDVRFMNTPRGAGDPGGHYGTILSPFTWGTPDLLWVEVAEAYGANPVFQLRGVNTIVSLSASATLAQTGYYNEMRIVRQAGKIQYYQNGVIRSYANPTANTVALKLANDALGMALGRGVADTANHTRMKIARLRITKRARMNISDTSYPVEPRYV